MEDRETRPSGHRDPDDPKKNSPNNDGFFSEIISMEEKGEKLKRLA